MDTVLTYLNWATSLLGIISIAFSFYTIYVTRKEKRKNDEYIKRLKDKKEQYAKKSKGIKDEY